MKKPGKFYRINRQISVTPVMVMFEGKNIGQMSLTNALAMAESHGLDLVEINHHQRPPVCSIIDYSKFKYEQSIKQKKDQAKQIQMKEIRLRPVSGDHDVNVKIEQIKKFLGEGKKVTVVIEFKGRIVSTTHANANTIVNKILTEINECGKLEHPPRMDGKKLIARINPQETKK